MKIFLILITLCSIQAGAKSFKKDVIVNVQIAADSVTINEKRGFYVCEVEAFTEKFEATAATEIEAKFKARGSCVAKHDEMFCRDLKCDGETISSGKWICRVKVFGKSFETLADSKTEARYRVKKDCVAKNSKIHCSEISCEQ